MGNTLLITPPFRFKGTKEDAQAHMDAWNEQARALQRALEGNPGLSELIAPQVQAAHDTAEQWKRKAQGDATKVGTLVRGAGRLLGLSLGAAGATEERFSVVFARLGREVHSGPTMSELKDTMRSVLTVPEAEAWDEEIARIAEWQKSNKGKKS